MSSRLSAPLNIIKRLVDYPVDDSHGLIIGEVQLQSRGDLLGTPRPTITRLLHRSIVINLDGESFRLRDHYAAAETLRRTTTGTRQTATLTTAHR